MAWTQDVGDLLTLPLPEVRGVPSPPKQSPKETQSMPFSATFLHQNRDPLQGLLHAL